MEPLVPSYSLFPVPSCLIPSSALFSTEISLVKKEISLGRNKISPGIKTKSVSEKAKYSCFYQDYFCSPFLLLSAENSRSCSGSMQKEPLQKGLNENHLEIVCTQC